MQVKQRRASVSRRSRDGARVNNEETAIASSGDVPSHPAIREAFGGGGLQRLWTFRLSAYVGPSTRGLARCDA